MKVKQFVRISILVLVVFAIIANLGLLQTLACNMTAPKLPLDETFSWRNGKYERIFYGDSDAQYIDLYVPKDTLFPRLFVMVHGGGFIFNDAQSRQAQFMYRYFRDHGYACASVNYRLAGEAPFPAACDDVHEAVVYLARHASEYGYDASHIAIWGESAGGYLATREALTETDAPITDLVSYYGIYDFQSAGTQFRQQGISRFVRSLANFWAVGNTEGYPSFEEYWVRKPYEEWTDADKQIISVQHIAESGPANRNLRVLLVHGSTDITVPNQQSANLAEALKAYYGDENVIFALMDSRIHADDRLFTDEMLGLVDAFLQGRQP
ncbi:MAG: alpha/beta hydrolase [Oscillospiraceae bacterium]|nr:alpha/beta hydrolase [Oscillospiraceae bacterium]